MTPRIAVTGLGLITPLGSDPNRVFDAIAAGQSAIRPEPALRERGLHCGAAARVSAVPPAPGLLRGPAMALGAAQQALASAGLGAPMGAAGLYVTSAFGAPGGWVPDFASGGVESRERARAALADGISQRVASLAHALGAQGPVHSLQAQCAGNAIFTAALDDLRRGATPWALAGGFEEIMFGPLACFDRVRALGDACRPFDVRRQGAVISEGAAFLVLEPWERARERGATVYAELLAMGNANDAYDLVAPDPEGEGASLALRRALNAAGVGPAEVSAVNAHGTGTPLNDGAEARALRRVLGDGPWQLNSIKGAVGHPVGAAGPVEAVLVALSVYRQQWMPTVGLEEIDPALQVEAMLRRSDGPLNVVLSNGFGFGGHDAVAVFARPGRGAPKRGTRPVYIAGGEALAPGVRSLEDLLRRVQTAGLAAVPIDLQALQKACDERGLRHADEHTYLVREVYQRLAPWPIADPDRAGVILGAAYPGFGGAIRSVRRLVSGGPTKVFPMSVPHTTSSATASWLAMKTGARGLNLTVGSHHNAGLDAIALAHMYLGTAQADEILAGGVHAPVSPLNDTLRVAGERADEAAAAVVKLTHEARGSWARIEQVHQGFGQQAAARLVEALPAVDLWVGPALPGLSAPRRVDLSDHIGPVSAAGGALGVLWAAAKIRAGEVRRAAVGELSPLGWASVIVLTCPTG